MTDKKPVDKGPDPSPGCPRCHYFSQLDPSLEQRRRSFESQYPHGIDQQKALDLLVKAFPKSYGAKQ